MKKKKISFIKLFRTFCAFLIVLPVGTLIASCLGYDFELMNYSVFGIVTSGIAVCILSMSGSVEDSSMQKIDSVFSILCAPLSLVNCVFYLYKSQFFLVVLSMFVCICCCFYITVALGRPKVLKIISTICSILVFIPIGFAMFISLIFGSIGKNAIVQTVYSPDKSYYAEVVDSDQGALGGDTIVNVYEDKGVDIFVLKIIKKPQQIYRGAWGEFKDMQIAWKDDSSLMINSVEYKLR